MVRSLILIKYGFIRSKTNDDFVAIVTMLLLECQRLISSITAPTAPTAPKATSIANVGLVSAVGTVGSIVKTNYTGYFKELKKKKLTFNESKELTY